MRFWKYHGLGNDYLVVEEGEIPLAAPLAERLCDRHFGVGADGVLVDRGADASGSFAVRIFNPDGSEAEKSGNGLRIFSRYLWDRGRIREQEAFRVATAAGSVVSTVAAGGRAVTVEMGTASFQAAVIPVEGPAREVLQEEMTIDGQVLRYSAVTIGNPHCVLLVPAVSPELARRLGPLIERASRFPRRTNVQFVEVIDRGTIRLEIWERGAGYTLASGSSSCAAAAVCRRLGLCDAQVLVRMPGGSLDIAIDEGYRVRMKGPVTKVAEGVASPECLEGVPDGR